VGNVCGNRGRQTSALGRYFDDEPEDTTSKIGRFHRQIDGDVTYDLAARSVTYQNGAGGVSVSASYRDLRVWQRSTDLVVRVYEETQDFPKAETYGLTSQMRCAAISVPSNIAEGKGRFTDRDRSHFFSQARGSLLELETQTDIALRLSYLSEPSAKLLIAHTTDVGRMLNSLIESIRPKNSRSAA
jgi:four helix bundle protein